MPLTQYHIGDRKIIKSCTEEYRNYWQVVITHSLEREEDHDFILFHVCHVQLDGKIGEHLTILHVLQSH